MQRTSRYLKRFQCLITAPSVVQQAATSTAGALDIPPPFLLQNSRYMHADSLSTRLLSPWNVPVGPRSRGLATTPDKEDEDPATMEAEILEAFDNLISASYDLANEGKPAEAEHILKEGAAQAAEVLGPENAVMVAPLYDQLAVMQFMHDRSVEAQESAKQAYDIMQQFAAEVDSPAGHGAAAAAGMRYGIVLLAGGSPHEAQPLLKQVITSLNQVMEAVEGAGMLQEKFATAIGEAQFYEGLCSLFATPIQAWDIADIKGLSPQLLSGLSLMNDHLGQHHPLIACALREHDKAIQLALQADRFDVTEALLKQGIQLHDACNPESEHVAMMLYQLGTLQYVMSDYKSAHSVLEKALGIIKGFEEGEEHAITIKHRLGLVHGALGQFEAAKTLLHGVAPDLVQHLGTDNPISAELNFMLAMIALKQAELAGKLDAEKKSQLVSEMKENLKALEDYGQDHMLVKKAKDQFEEISASL